MLRIDIVNSREGNQNKQKKRDIHDNDIPSISHHLGKTFCHPRYFEKDYSKSPPSVSEFRFYVHRKSTIAITCVTMATAGNNG